MKEKGASVRSEGKVGTEVAEAATATQMGQDPVGLEALGALQGERPVLGPAWRQKGTYQRLQRRLWGEGDCGSRSHTEG